MSPISHMKPRKVMFEGWSVLSFANKNHLLECEFYIRAEIIMITIPSHLFSYGKMSVKDKDFYVGHVVKIHTQVNVYVALCGLWGGWISSFKNSQCHLFKLGETP